MKSFEYLFFHLVAFVCKKGKKEMQIKRIGAQFKWIFSENCVFCQFVHFPQKMFLIRLQKKEKNMIHTPKIHSIYSGPLFQCHIYYYMALMAILWYVLLSVFLLFRGFVRYGFHGFLEPVDFKGLVYHYRTHDHDFLTLPLFHQHFFWLPVWFFVQH